MYYKILSSFCSLNKLKLKKLKIFIIFKSNKYDNIIGESNYFII